MELMNWFCMSMLDQLVIGFTDDILAYSKTNKPNEEHLGEVLETLKSERLYVKFSECAILMQRGHVITYTLKQLKPHDANYPTHDLELGVVVFSFKIWRWLDVVNDYDCDILYRLGKANVVVDTLSRKATNVPIRDLFLRMSVTSPLLDLIKEAQIEGLKEENQKNEKTRGQISTFIRDIRGLLTKCGRVWVLFSGGVRQTLLEEVHKSKFSIHLGTTKMYRDLRLS
ncbi:hypothetical protein Lser_V15G28376 [Lactuca serriola]